MSAAVPRLPILMLAAGQTLVWAGLFYSFAALLPVWEADLGWSKAQLSLGFTLALLAAGLLAPLAGRVVDAGAGRALLGFGAIAGALALVGLAQVNSPLMFIAVWVLIGAIQAASLYEPCFAFVTRATGPGARVAITRITLIAGFASTLAFPSLNLLAGAFGWRMAVLIAALVLALLAAPLMFFGALLLERESTHSPAQSSPGGDKAALRAALARPEFWLIAAAFSFLALNHGILLAHILPLLADRGVAAGAAILAASMIGPAQVAGRVVMMRLESRLGTGQVALWAFGTACLSAVVLWLAGLAPVLVFLFAILQGAAFGVMSILRPVMLAETLGLDAFGAISARVARAYITASALAPFAGAQLWRLGGYDLVILSALVLAAASLASAMLLRRLER